MKAVITNHHSDDKTFSMNGIERSFDEEIELTEQEYIVLEPMLDESNNKKFTIVKKEIELVQSGSVELSIDYVSDIVIKEIELFDSINKSPNHSEEAIIAIYTRVSKIINERTWS